METNGFSTEEAIIVKGTLKRLGILQCSKRKNSVNSQSMFSVVITCEVKMYGTHMYSRDSNACAGTHFYILSLHNPS